MLRLIALLCLIAGALGYWGAQFWLFDLFAHFRVQYALIAMLLLIVLLIRRDLYAVAAFAALVLNLLPIIPYYADRDDPPSPLSIKLMTHNVLSHNARRHDELLAILASDADVVVLLEINPAWQRALKPLAPFYPHRIIIPRADNFGIALLSRLPIRTQQVLDPGGLPSLHVQLQKAQRTFHLIATHPEPPVSADATRARDRQLMQLADYVAKLRGAVILSGDFNLSPFSERFAALCAASDLHDASLGHGLAPTWQPHLPVAIRIDHVLLSRGLSAREFRVGPALGSDHAMVHVTIGID